MPRFRHRRLPNTPESITIHVTDAGGADEIRTYNIEAAAPIISTPTANDDAASVTVNGAVIIPVLVNDVSDGFQLQLVDITSVPSGGTATIEGNSIRYIANGATGADSFVYSVRATDGEGNFSAETTATVNITKTPEAAAGSGTVALSVLDVNNAQSGSYVTTARNLPAPAGHFFRAVASGFGVGEHFTDVRYKWNFGDPGCILRNNKDHNSGGTGYDIADNMPWDRVYDVDGTNYVIRGPKVYDAATETEQTSLSTVLTPQVGFEPNFGTNRTFLGYWGNVAYGPRVTHVFSQPGSYTVTCEVQKRGESPVIETIPVTVLDPDTYFQDTFVVATDGNFTGAPSGTQFTNVDSAINAINSGSFERRRRLVLKRGQTHGSGGQLAPNGNMEFFGLYAFGSGAKPILRKGLFFNSIDTTNAVNGIRIRPGSYRSRDPFNTSPSRNGVSKGRDGWVTLNDVDIDRCSNGISFTAQNRQGLIGQDIYCTDWHKYGFFANNGSGGYGIKGFFFKADVEAIMGEGEDETSPPFYIDHGPQRSAPLGGPVYFGLSDLRAVGSRTAQTNDNSFQPCLRLGRSTSGRGPIVEEAVIDRMFGELGSLFGTGSSADSARPRLYLWDKCYNSSIGKSGEAAVNARVLGLHFRNIVHVIPDVPNVDRRYILRRGNHDKSSAVDSSLMEEYGVALYNSTFVDLRTYANHGFDIDRLMNGQVGNGTAQNPQYRPAAFVHIGNLVVEAPNKSIPDDTGSLPLNTVEFRRSTYPGARWGNANGDSVTGLNTNYAIPAGVYAFYFPEPGSNAYKTASVNDSAVGNGQGSDIAVDDFWGNLRGSTTSKGAFD